MAQTGRTRRGGGRARARRRAPRARRADGTGLPRHPVPRPDGGGARAAGWSARRRAPDPGRDPPVPQRAPRDPRPSRPECGHRPRRGAAVVRRGCSATYGTSRSCRTPSPTSWPPCRTRPATAGRAPARSTRTAPIVSRHRRATPPRGPGRSAATSGWPTSRGSGIAVCRSCADLHPSSPEALTFLHPRRAAVPATSRRRPGGRTSGPAHARGPQVRASGPATSPRWPHLTLGERADQTIRRMTEFQNELGTRQDRVVAIEALTELVAASSAHRRRDGRRVRGDARPARAGESSPPRRGRHSRPPGPLDGHEPRFWALGDRLSLCCPSR